MNVLLSIPLSPQSCTDEAQKLKNELHSNSKLDAWAAEASVAG